MSKYISIYSFLLNSYMTISKESLLDFLEDLKQNIIQDIIDINNVLIDLLCITINTCETKAQLRVICEILDLIKNKDLELFNNRIEEISFLLSQNTVLFKNLKSVVSSKSYLDSILYKKIIEKYIKKDLDNIVEITPNIKEDFEYYKEIINTFDVEENDILHTYKHQINDYIDTIHIQELTEDAILSEIIENRNEEAVS